jgi:carbon-monoxide dehydrogenase medium subunit
MAAAAPLIADPIPEPGTLVGSLCHADPQGDWASVVTSLAATSLRRPGGSRSISITDFVTGPFQNALAPDEIAIEAVIPAPRGALAGGYLKLERRVGDFATVGVAVATESTGGKVTRAGIALTGVGGSTISATEAAGSLVGQSLTAESIAQAADLAAAAARPRTDHRGSAEYKRHMVRTFVVRLLSRSANGAGSAGGDPSGSAERAA